MFDNPLRRLPQVNNPGLRLLIIVGPPLIALMVAYTLTWPQNLYVLGALGALAGSLILLNWPILGIVSMIIAISMFPVVFSTGTKTSLSIAVLLVPALLVLWIFDLIAQRRQYQLHMISPVYAALGLAGSAFLAFILGQLPWFALAPAPLTAQLGGLAVFLFSVGAFLLTIHHIEERVWLERITWLFLLVATLQMISNMMPNFLPLRQIFHPLNNSIVITWLVALAFGLALFNRKLHQFWRVVLVLVVLLAFFLTFVRLRSWASGWVPGLVALLVIVWAWRPRLGLVLTVIVAGVGLFYSTDIVDTVILEDNIYSVDTRLAAWKVLFELIDVNPFLGLGPANYYWYTPLYSILGYNVQFNSHNQYVDIIAQTGLIGTAFFGWWAVSLARLGWRLRTKVEAGFEQAFVYAAIGGLAGTLFAGLLGDWVLPFVYNVGLGGFRGSVVAWLMLGGLVALDNIYQKKQAPALATVEA